jgi:hypothetical protein
MTGVITSALEAEDETVLEDALVEFNELAEIEPAFFSDPVQRICKQLDPPLAPRICSHSD